MAPAWAIIIFSAGVVYSCASILPCIVATLFAALAPPAIWLVLAGSPFDRSIAMCMAASLPFTNVFGLFAARRMRVSIISRLEIASLLAGVQRAQSERARFYSSASHDLRQPVHALGFYTSLLQSITDAGERHDIVQQIDECARSLDRQFNAILSVADVNQSVERARPRVIAIQPVLNAVATRIMPEAIAKDLRIRVAATQLFAYADPDLLERAIGNLATNAVRYTRSGGVLIGVRRAGPRIRICVLDSGIPDDEQKLIFEDFYQVGNRERARDRGLGLAIVRRLCAAADWGLELSSVVNRGSQFSMIVSAATPPEAPERAPPRVDERPLPASLVVLVVDDDPLVRDATSRLLVHWGVRVELCSTSAEAVVILAARHPGESWHVLLDRRLAGIDDGFAFARQLTGIGDATLRVAMMSADANEELVRRGREIGIEVLRKPIKAIRLRALLSAP